MFNNLVVNRILQGKKANWLIDADKKHALTLTSDAAKAIALLGNVNYTYNQVWHLPTDTAYTANELAAKIESIIEQPAKIQVMSNFMVKFISNFNSGLRESKELLYQFDRDYVFNSSKFQNAFPNSKPTPIKQGLKELINQKKA